MTLSIVSTAAAHLPGTVVNVWRADLDAGTWPEGEALPAAERERAARLLRPLSRNRWIAARWALRTVLGSCLGDDPAAVELRVGPHGKPMLADPSAPLQFNLSHSGGQALVAVAPAHEVGVDLERIVPGKHSVAFYSAWTRREAIVKCHGTGRGAPPPREAEVSVSKLDLGPGFVAALAVSDR